MITIIIPQERPVSWNSFYAGQHFSVRAKEAKRVHHLMRTYLVVNGVRMGDTLKVQVKITLTCYFKNRPLDADNLAAKLYIDGLKGWIIEDDTPKFVRSVETISLVDKLDPRVEITIAEVTL